MGCRTTTTSPNRINSGDETMKRNIQIEKCVAKYCRKMIKVDHSLDIPGFGYACGMCKKHSIESYERSKKVTKQ